MVPGEEGGPAYEFSFASSSRFVSTALFSPCYLGPSRGGFVTSNDFHPNIRDRHRKRKRR